MRRHAPGMAGAAGLQDLGQPEVGEPGRAADEEGIVRLDIAVLDPDQSAAVAERVPRLVEEVERLGQVVHVAEQLVARQARQALRLAVAEPVHQAPLAERHGDDQAIGHADGELDVEQMGMADVADDLQRALLQPGLLGVEPDELQRDADAAGGQRLPDLAKPAPTQHPDERIARDGLDAGLQVEGRQGPREWRARSCTAFARRWESALDGGRGIAFGVVAVRVHPGCRIHWNLTCELHLRVCGMALLAPTLTLTPILLKEP